MQCFRAHTAVQHAGEADLGEFESGGWFDAAIRRTTIRADRAAWIDRLRRGPPGSRARHLVGVVKDWLGGKPLRVRSLSAAAGRPIAVNASSADYIQLPAACFFRGARSSGPKRESWHTDCVEIATTSIPSQSGAVRSRIATFFRDWLEFATGLVESYVSDVRRQRAIPKRLLTGTGALVWNAIIRSVVQERGGETVGCDHGSGFSQWSLDCIAASEFSFATKFVTLSDSLKACCELTDPRFLLQAQPIQIVSREEATEFHPPQRLEIRNVLFVLAPLMGERWLHMAPMHADPLLFDWQVRAIGMLRRMGFGVTAKAHPEHLQGARWVAQVTGARIEERPFELITSEYDAVIYDYPWSSTFRTAVNAGMAITLVNFQQFSLRPNVKDLYARRISIVNGTSNRRLYVDEEAFRSAIVRSGNMAG